jgi:hypothetical protein
MKTCSQTELEPAVKAERERFKAVITSAAYHGRETSAAHMLLTTDLTAEQICGTLAGLAAPVGDFQQGKDIATGLPASMRRT